MTVGVLGASGTVGAAVLRQLDELGLDGRPVGTDDDLLGDQAPGVIISAVGGDRPGLREQVRRAAASGRDVVEVDPEVGYIGWLLEEVAPAAAAAGSRVLVGVGVRGGVGDLLAALAAGTLPGAREVSVAYTAGGSTQVRSPGERRSVIAALGRPVPVLVDGRRTEEQPGEHRRLAWFPRPLGPSHAAVVHGAEALTVPRHRPEVTTVRTYDAVGGWRAELLQARANLARTARGRAFLERRLASRPPAGPTALAAQRWGCVAEVLVGNELGRAWAYGTDPAGTTASLAVAVTELLLTQGPEVIAPGVHSLGESVPPDTTLDTVGDRTGLRWSRTSVTLDRR